MDWMAVARSRCITAVADTRLMRLGWLEVAKTELRLRNRAADATLTAESEFVCSRMVRENRTVIGARPDLVLFAVEEWFRVSLHYLMSFGPIYCVMAMMSMSALPSHCTCSLYLFMLYCCSLCMKRTSLLEVQGVSSSMCFHCHCPKIESA